MFIDTGIYDDGDLYQDDAAIFGGFIVRQEAHSHFYGVTLRYVAQLVPGSGEAFQVARIALRAAIDRQAAFTHAVFIDRVEFTDHVGLTIRHTGSDFQLYHAQLITKNRRNQVRM